ncbi:hypothetical protein [Streptomyces sp. TLI_105]|uniref:hypothetical protein n=1 Tax=Streptomyces sp. TLI_105 TaxID=1881019 RepID=UPI000895383E|nr:hypothetical protein [Streptomyces sp. TLI_105]SEE58887.1 hypothetical protein SAMN05428939_8014 [Streptomyces sp. TLI_105]
MAFGIRMHKGGRGSGAVRTPAATLERSRSRTTTGGEEKPWSTETEVWFWTQNAIFSGYGPLPSAFLRHGLDTRSDA